MGCRSAIIFPIFTSHGKKDFTVEGIFKPTGVGEVFGGNIAVMDIYSAQVVFGRGHNFDRIDLMNAPGVPVNELQQRLRARLPPGIEVMRPEMKGQALENAVTAMRLGMLITSFIALLVGVYIIFNSFTIAVNQRWKEIGILRAVGVERGNINAMFLGEALVMGVIGSCVGIVAGYYLAIGANHVMGSIAASVYGIVSIAVAPRLHADLVLTSFGLGVAASLAGAWIPARAASYLDPILALHNIESRQKESALGWGRATLGAGLLLASVLLIQFSPSGVGMEFEFSYAAVMLLGLTMLLPMLVHWAARAIRPAMDRVGGSEGALAVDAMIQSPRRSAATVGALMVGLMFVYSTARIHPELQAHDPSLDRPDAECGPDGGDVDAAAVDVVPLQRGPGQTHCDAAGGEDRGERAVHAGPVSRRYGRDYGGAHARLSGALVRRDLRAATRRTFEDLLPKGKGVLVSKNFATRWGYKIGDRVHLDTPTGPLDLPIVGDGGGLPVGQRNDLHGAGGLQDAIGKTTRWTLSTSA